jgi:transposase
MGQKRTNKQYSKEYKEAVALIRDQGYTVPEASKSLGMASNIRYRWKDKITSNLEGISLSTDEQEELFRLRKENKNLRMEKEILKNRLRAHTSHRIETQVQVHQNSARTKAVSLLVNLSRQKIWSRGSCGPNIGGNC